MKFLERVSFNFIFYCWMSNWNLGSTRARIPIAIPVPHDLLLLLQQLLLLLQQMLLLLQQLLLLLLQVLLLLLQVLLVWGVGCGATGLINCVCKITEIRNNLAAARPWGSIISNTTASSLDNTPQHHHQPRIRPAMGQRLAHLFPVCCFLWISH